MDPVVQSDRKRVKRLAVIVIFIVGLFLVLRSWHDRAIDVEIVHHATVSADLLPVEIMIQVWSGETLHADAYFPNPSSLDELSHTVRVPPGDYRVTYTIMRTYPQPEYRFERQLTIEAEGRYFLSYELLTE